MAGVEVTDVLPVTVEYRGRSIDLTLPSYLAIANFLPAVLSQRKWLVHQSAAWAFHLVMSDGTVLNSQDSLVEQGVTPGAVLRLELPTEESSVRYDDLVEAMGDSVADVRTPWKQGDSVLLSSYVAAGLVIVSGALLALGSVPPLLGGLVTSIGALLMILVAGVVQRASATRDLPGGGAVSLALSATFLFGVCAYCLTPGTLWLRLAAAGAAMVAGSVTVFVLTKNSRGYAGITVTAGAVLALLSLQEWAWQLPPQRAAALLVGLVCLIVLLLPWVGVARMPVRLDALSPTPHNDIVAEEVSTQLRGGENLTIALRIGAGICVIGLAPLIVVDAYGSLLMTAVCLALLLGTRSLYGRTEVYIGLVSGIIALTATGVLLGVNRPDLFPWVVVVAVVVSGFIIANNIISAKLRPRLTRAADVINIAAIAAICPFIALVWGVV